jgi:hypothetical protein
MEPSISASASGNLWVQAPGGTTVIGSGIGDITINPGTGGNQVYVNLNTGGSGTGDFNVRSNGVSFLTLSEVGAATFTQPVNQKITVNAAATTIGSTGGLTGGVVDINADTTTASTVGLSVDFTSNDGGASGSDIYAQRINLVQNDTDSNLFGLHIGLAATSATIGDSKLVDCLLCLQNLENQAGAIESAIRIRGAALTAAITNGLNMSGATDITNDIVLQNGAVIDNDISSFVRVTGNLNVIGQNGTLAIASVSGRTSYAAMIVDNSGVGDIFTASSSGRNRFVIRQNGNVHIGTQSAALNQPTYKLFVSDYNIATAAASIENTARLGQTGQCSRTVGCVIGLNIKLGQPGSNVDPNVGNRFLQFQRGDGLVVGKFQGTGTSAVAYTATGADYGEYFRKENPSETLNPFTPVCLGPTGGVTACDSVNDQPVGVISDRSIVIGNDKDGDENYVIVGLIGQLPVKVSTANGDINPGDALSPSSIPGVAVKALKNSTSIGKAIASYSGGGIGEVETYVSIGYVDPTESLSHISIDGTTLVSDTDYRVDGSITATTASIGSASQFAIDMNGNATTSGSFSFAAASIFSEDHSLVSQLAADIDGNGNPTKFAFRSASGTELLGLDSNGNATISGTLTTNVGNYDLAEDYPTQDDGLEAGDIVSADNLLDGFVAKSKGSYDKTVIGIYSEKPGFRLSQAGGTIDGARAVPIALAGRVPVKVSTENGVIKKGDYLTTSSVSGIAMKATKPGQTIGKALEDFNGTSGKVIAFVNVSFADPGNLFDKFSFDSESNIVVSRVSAETVKIPSNITIAGVETNGTLTGALLAIDSELARATGGISALQTAVLGVQDKTSELDTRVITLEEKQASTAAELARTIDSATSLQDRVSSTSAGINDLNSRLDALLAQIASGSTMASTSAIGSGSASYNELVEGLNDVDSLISSGSAAPSSIGVVSNAQLGDEIEAYGLTVKDTFTSLGLSYLGGTSISGDVTVAGTSYLSDTSIVGVVTIDDITLTEASINVKGVADEDGVVTGGTLFLQNSVLAGDIDIFNGGVTIQKDGTISARGNVKVEGDLNVEGAITTSAVAGENIKAHDALYVATDGVVKKADSNFADRSNIVGVAATNAAKGAKVTVIIGGKAKGFQGLNAGTKYYLSSGGQMTPTPPLNQQNAITVGVAFSESELVVQTGK